MGNMTVEPIRNDLLAFDFNDSEELGIRITGPEYETFKLQDWALSTDGKLYLNKASTGYKFFLEAFTKMCDFSTEDIEKMYDELCFYYPDDNDFCDMSKYTEDIHIKNVFVKILFPVELQKRKQGKDAIERNLMILFSNY